MARASACEEEVRTAWLLFRFNWAVLGILSAAFAIAIGLAGFSINVGDLLFSLGFVIIYAASMPRSRMPMRARRHGAIRR